MLRSDERGIALVMALLMTLLVSMLTASMIAIGRSETISSLSYRSMSQVRYGAESGVHAAANHLLNTYVSPGASAADPLANYDMTVSPVTFGGNPVVLSSDPDVPSNYPVAAVRDAFVAGSQGFLNVDGRQVAYAARATLISMRQLTDPFTGTPSTLQTWQIAGVGSLDGVGESLVEVEATLERQPVPAYQYAAFATFDGCNALSFAGGATTGSYDSNAALSGGKPVISTEGGHVGTNGNLDANGDPTTINGTLSTPRAGVGNCTTNNVTAATVSGWAAVEDGLVTLPQAIPMPTPDPFTPVGPDVSFGNNCPAAAPYCTESGGELYVSPPAGTVVQLGNVSLQGNSKLNLRGGVYEINSLDQAGNSTIKVVPGTGPVIIKVAGEGVATPIKLTGGGVSNPTFDPTLMQIIYGGDGNIQIAGGADTSALIYAPNATAALSGGAEYYGAIVTRKVTATGGMTLNYDRRLQNTMLVAGNPTMTSFTWRTF